MSHVMVTSAADAIFTILESEGLLGDAIDRALGGYGLMARVAK